MDQPGCCLSFTGAGTREWGVEIPTRWAGVGAAGGLCGGFPRGVVNAGVFGAFGRRASAVDGAFKPVVGRDRFGHGRIDLTQAERFVQGRWDAVAFIGV